MPTYTVYETHHSSRSVVVDAADEDEAVELASAIDWDDWERDVFNSWSSSSVEEVKHESI